MQKLHDCNVLRSLQLSHTLMVIPGGDHLVITPGVHRCGCRLKLVLMTFNATSVYLKLLLLLGQSLI